jgi:hypothetical protein
MDNQFVIQVLEKNDYTKQHLVSLPSALPPLAPSSVRVKTSLISLTTNNLTYARLGEMLGWWGVHPLPSNIPSEFSDSTKYGRISAWGYAEIIESTFEGAPTGSFVFGYLAIGTLPVDLSLKSVPAPNQAVETSPHRQHLFPIYNRYIISAAPSASTSDSRAWDALMQPLFETSYNLNAAVLPPLFRDPVHPLGDPSSLGYQAAPWTKPDSDISSAVVLILAASGKTALSFAHQLRHARPPPHQPRKIIALTSHSSKTFVEGTNFYDQVLLYSSSPTEAGITPSDKVLLCDFGGRGTATGTWLSALKPQCASLVWLGIGGESRLMDGAELAARGAQAAAGGMQQVNASGLRDAEMESMGEAEYFEDFLKTWEGFKRDGGVPGLKFKFARGMDAVVSVWGKICEGAFRPDEGDLIEL